MKQTLPVRQPGKPVNDFKKERKKERQKRKERKKLFVKDIFCQLKEQNLLLSLPSVKFVNDFDDSINFHSVNFH